MAQRCNAMLGSFHACTSVVKCLSVKGVFAQISISSVNRPEVLSQHMQETPIMLMGF